MRILSLITHSDVVPNPWDLRSSSEHKLRYFWWYLRALWPSHRQQGSLHDQGPEKYQDDRQSSLCDISLSTVILRSHENTFCAKKTKIMILFHIFISTVSLVDVRSRQYMTQAIQIQRDDAEHKACQRVRELSDSNKNILICVPKMNGGLTCLEQHQSE